MFSHMDVDLTSDIDEEEFLMTLRTKLKIKASTDSDEVINSLFEFIDADNSKRITMQEFARFCREAERELQNSKESRFSMKPKEENQKNVNKANPTSKNLNKDKELGSSKEKEKPKSVPFATKNNLPIGHASRARSIPKKEAHQPSADVMAHAHAAHASKRLKLKTFIQPNLAGGHIKDTSDNQHEKMIKKNRLAHKKSVMSKGQLGKIQEKQVSERRASLDEDEQTRDESREMAADGYIQY